MSCRKARGGSPSATAPPWSRLAAPGPLDLTRQANGDVALVLTVRRDAGGEGVAATMGCGAGCGGTVALPELAQAAAGEWRTVAVPLKCFAAAGTDMARVAVPLRLQVPAHTTVSLARVALGTAADATVACRH